MVLVLVITRPGGLDAGESGTEADGLSPHLREARLQTNYTLALTHVRRCAAVAATLRQKEDVLMSQLSPLTCRFSAGRCKCNYSPGQHPALREADVKSPASPWCLIIATRSVRLDSC